MCPFLIFAFGRGSWVSIRTASVSLFLTYACGLRFWCEYGGYSQIFMNHSAMKTRNILQGRVIVLSIIHFSWKRCFFSLLQCIYFHAFCLPQGYQLTLRFMFSYHIFFNVLCSLLLSNVFSQSLYSCCKLKVILILNNHTCSLMKMFCYTEPWWPAKHILTYLATLPTW